MQLNKSSFNIIPLFLVILIDSVGWGVAFPVFEPLLVGNVTGILSSTTGIGLRNFYYEMVIAIYCICMFLGSPVLGSLSDRYGRKIILQVSMLGAALGLFCCALGSLWSSIVLILAGRIISGITAGSLPIAQAAMVDMSTPEALPSRLGLVSIANGIGFACGPIIGGFLLDASLFSHASYQLPFIACSVFALIGVILISCMFKETYQGNRQQKIDLLMGFHNIRSAFTEKATSFSFIGFLFFLIGYTIFFSMIPLLLAERFKVGGAGIGFFMTYFAVVFSVGLIILLPRLTKRFSLANITKVSLLIQILFYVLVVFAQSKFVLWLLIAPIAVTVPFIFVGIVTAISQATDSAHQGKIMGVVGSVTALAWAIGPIFSGIVTDVSLIWPYVLSILFIVAAMLGMFGSSKTGQKELGTAAD